MDSAVRMRLCAARAAPTFAGNWLAPRECLPYMDQRDVFLQAAEKQNPADRQAFLDAACGGDVDMRSQVESMLVALRELGDDSLGASKVLDSWRPLAAQQAAPELAPPQSSDEIGRLGNYRILGVLGQGGMGIVYRGEDLQLSRQVAVKVLAPGLASELDSKQRFIREAWATAQIENDHVVPVFQVGEDRGIPFLVMPLLKGEPLDQWLERTPQLTVPQVLRIGREIASGLSAAHDRGLIHRDIKPANVWLEAPLQRIKILDFGLARLMDDPTRTTKSGCFVGTPSYMSPEQAEGMLVDHRTDLFSLGALLYKACTGELPFQGKTVLKILTALASSTPVPVQNLNPELPPDFAELIMQLLAKDRNERPQTASEVITRIEAIERRLTSDLDFVVGKEQRLTGGRSKRPTLTEAPIVRPKRNGRGVGFRHVAVFAASVALTALVGWLVFGRGSSAPQRDPKRVAVAATTPFHATPFDTTSAPEPTDEASASLLPPLPVAGKKLPVKVFLLAGQSNMLGKATIKSVPWLAEDPETVGMLAKLKQPDNSWTIRDDVWVYCQGDNGRQKSGPLSVGFGASDKELGPELLFGQVLGERFENQILLIKVSQGSLALAKEGRPPSSGGVTGSYYRKLIWTIQEVLANVTKYYPDYEGQGVELAGFVWFHGWNDCVNPDFAAEYEFNLINLIRDVRTDLNLPQLPIVIGEFGVGGVSAKEEYLRMRRAQAAVTSRPEFAGTVALARTADCWDPIAHELLKKGWDSRQRKWSTPELSMQFEAMGGQEEYHYMGSAKVICRIGQRLGEAMQKLLQPGR